MIKARRLFKSFQYAFRGLFKVFKEEQNLKIQSLSAIIVLFFGFKFKISTSEWLILVLSISLVFLTEILNSAIERVTDILKPRLDSCVKEIKDVMAAAVMVASISATIAGLIIFFPHLIRIWKSF